jgi:hypothetical protein
MGDIHGLFEEWTRSTGEQDLGLSQVAADSCLLVSGEVLLSICLSLCSSVSACVCACVRKNAYC